VLGSNRLLKARYEYENLGGTGLEPACGELSRARPNTKYTAQGARLIHAPEVLPGSRGQLAARVAPKSPCAACRSLRTFCSAPAS